METVMNKLAVQLPAAAMVTLAAAIFMVTEAVSALAVEKNGYDFPSAGIGTVLNPSSFEIETVEETEEELDIYEKFNVQRERMGTELAMANVTYTLNVRSDASEEAKVIGYLYRDCGGSILEEKDGWSLIQSGSLKGWCSNEFLLTGDEAIGLAEDVGQWLVTSNSEALRVRKDPSEDAEVVTIMSKADIADFVEIVDDKWIGIDINGELGYVDNSYIDINFHIDEGETKEQIQTRNQIEEQLRKAAEEKAAEEAKKNAAKNAANSAANKEKYTGNLGAVSADADELRLLAALIYCEAGNQPYEGMVGVGAVVMNRVKSPAYPNTMYSVIYASGQFTPAQSGKVARVYESGPPQLCYQAAAAAINGETTVGAATHFRRNNGRDGYVLGDHVFW